MFRFSYITTRYQNVNPGVGSGMWGRGWTYDNQIFLWSPKGFLTGSQTTPNSIMMSFGFERADMNCGSACTAGGGNVTSGYHQLTVLNREAALWYWLQPSLGVGMWWHYWTTSNTNIIESRINNGYPFNNPLC